MVNHDIISEINMLHSEVGQLERVAKDKAIRIGDLLSQCKQSLKHGEFVKWVEGHCMFSARTAQNYMKLFYNQDKIQDADSITESYRALKNETVSHLEDDDAVEDIRTLARIGLRLEREKELWQISRDLMSKYSEDELELLADFITKRKSKIKMRVA